MSRQVVVSGAASGIGKAVTELLRAAGDTVIGVDLRDVEVEADLSTSQGRQQAADRVLELTGGSLDAAILCAGLSLPKVVTVAVNYFGAVEFAEDLRPALAKSDSPRVVIISSAVSGTQTTDPATVQACLDHDEEAALAAAGALVEAGRGQMVYTSSKNAIAQWVRRSAVDWAGNGIALNAVAPGVVRTPMARALSDDPKMKDILDQTMPMPLGGHSEAEDIAPVVAFLASEGNHLVTGQNIYADGGVEVSLRPMDRV